MTHRLEDNQPQVEAALRLARLTAGRDTKVTDDMDLFVCAGRRSSMIGGQDGGFPDFGHHVPDEMGGLWAHPIKLMDGFWLHLSESADPSGGVWLERADAFRNFAYFNEHDYAIHGLGLEAVRSQFCPDEHPGFVVEYRLRDTSGRSRELTAVFQGRTELRPVWFSEEAGIHDAPDEARADTELGAVVAKDRDHPWFVVFGSDAPGCEPSAGESSAPSRKPTAGNGADGSLRIQLSLPANGTAELRFFIAGSVQSEAEAADAYRHIRGDHADMRRAKRLRYESLLARTELDIPDEELARVFDWVKVHSEWLVLDVPGVGRGLTAGIPEYPWWFGCDNSYALLGLLAVGRQALAVETSDLIRETSERTNGNGRIIHELTTWGLVANPGNTQETPHYIQSVREIFDWTGDLAYLKRAYPTVRQGLEWLLGEMDPDGDLLPEGYGITEIEGLNVELIDTAVYTWSALLAGAEMAELLGDGEIAAGWRGTAARLADKINTDLWLEKEGLYADAMARVEAVRQRMPVYIARAESMGADRAVQEMKAMQAEMKDLPPDEERPWLFKNWVINTPMETGLAPRDKAIRALARMGTDEFTGDAGTYLSGMYRTQMMTISTGVQAVAEARYDRMDESLRLVKLIASTFGRRLPGSISEMSPDYGCFVQAWTNYGIHWLIVRFMFGIEPKAHRRELTLRPRLPSEWREAAIRRVAIGEGASAASLDLEIALGDAVDLYKVKLAGEGWTVRMNLPRAAGARILAGGSPIEHREDGPDGETLIAIAGNGTFEVRVERR
ncbi:glycogen debranching protein [Cohnella sp. GbtcB17]|uniref:glycogen debranching protein n=1 Tax=Cohnella sp. GbtcB17 TaxID=2824762 RepID=UPI001C2F623F|nr:glycogen debranching protein [Cohnella sp. GbtcB17]